MSVDVWWFPGSYKQINNPCFGYWSARDSSKRPVQFFGITNLNQTVLQYYSFKPGEIPISKHSTNTMYIVCYMWSEYQYGTNCKVAQITYVIMLVMVLCYVQVYYFSKSKYIHVYIYMCVCVCVCVSVWVCACVRVHVHMGVHVHVHVCVCNS